MIEFFTRFKTIRTSYHQNVPTELLIYPKGTLTLSPDPKGSLFAYYREFYRIPDGRFIPKFRSNIEAQALSSLMYNDELVSITNAVVYDINPGFFESKFDIDRDTSTVSWYDDTGGVDIVPVEDINFYESALLGQPYIPIVSERVINTDTMDLFSSPDAGLNPVSFLTNYLTMDAVDPKVPLLIGHTGIAKSAIVKSATDSLGMRLIDIRCGFIDKTDIEGFANILPEGTYEQSPMKEMITATDQFVNAARKFVEENKDKELDADNLELLEVMREYSKTPVLFFDEVNRAPKSVRNAFTNILNKKEFLNYTMHEAKVVSAANVPVNNQDIPDEDMEQFYVVEEMSDIASLERFISIKIDPNKGSVRDNWIDWASSRRSPPFEDIILEFLRKKTDYAYDISSLSRATQTDERGNAVPIDPSEASDVKITTYRGWEQMNDYFVSQMKSSRIIPIQMVNNLLGDTDTTRDFIAYLESKGYTPKNDFISDNLTDTLKSGLDSGIPVLLAAGTSVGKTSRVRQYAKDTNSILIEIDLSLKDRTQIRGIPDREPLGSNILPPHLKDASLAGPLSDMMMNDPNLPREMTYFVPDKLMVDRLKRAKEEGRSVVLFFDECNRCSPVVMSSVFEAVSDNRFAGVQFSPGQIKVVAACNVGDDYGGVSRLDPAFTARFIMARKPNADESDYQSFLKWSSSTDSTGSTNIDPSLIHSMNSIGYEGYSTMMSLVKTRTIDKNVPTTRAIDSLSTILSSAAYTNSILRGSLISLGSDFSTMTDDQIISKLKSAKWVGNRPDSDVLLGDPAESVSGSDVLETFEATKNRSIILAYEQVVNSKRKSLFETYLGPSGVTSNILGFYNDAETIGRVLTIEDLIDSSLCEDYFKQNLSDEEMGTPEGATKISEGVYAILLSHSSGYTPKDILSLFKGSFNSLASYSVRNLMLKTLADKEGSEELMKRVDITSVSAELDSIFA